MNARLLASFALAGCSGVPDGGAFEVALADLPCSRSETATGAWESARLPGEADCGDGGASCCPWIRYPGGSTVRIEHALGRVPLGVLVYLSYDPEGREGALSSGDPARILAVDDQFVTLENRTEQRFYLRVVLE